MEEKTVIKQNIFTDLRLAVQFTISSRDFEIQLVVEDEAGSAQTGTIRILESTVLTNAGTGGGT